ncbi:hypothetical protein VNI00_009169 [Paramarasmius palmivorus]|uniref:Uncharacterized protein n=1 Tax=Paramarasmius palmivorus TaxID=297713 RepID=A0AAW0CNU0_9AGAR
MFPESTQASITAVSTLQKACAIAISIAVLFVASAVTVYKWRFPVTTIEGLEEECKAIQDTITGVWGQDLLGESEAQFKQVWRSQREEIENIKINAIGQPDSRTHLIEFMRFRWDQLYAIDASYTALRMLSASINLKIETEKKRRQYFCPADSYSSGVDSPNSESLLAQVVKAPAE